MYRFIKVKWTELNMEYPFMLYCNSIEQIMEHNEKYLSNEISDGFKNLIDVSRGLAHIKTPFGMAVRWEAELNETSIIEAGVSMESKITAGKVKSLLKYGAILIRPVGSYMVIDDSFEIIDEVISPTMKYPEYGESDISINRWDGGLHYYARIGNMTVEDDRGKVKWNTHQEAKRQALLFLEKTNSE